MPPSASLRTAPATTCERALRVRRGSAAITGDREILALRALDHFVVGADENVGELALRLAIDGHLRGAGRPRNPPVGKTSSRFGLPVQALQDHRRDPLLHVVLERD